MAHSAPARVHTAVYPGTFDPVTLGHMDIIQRATHFVDRLVVGVAANPDKQPLFSLEDRVSLLEEEVARLQTQDGLGPHARVEIKPFSCLLIDLVKMVGASVIVRGLRAISDFEYEFTMAGMNARLDPGVETVFLMADQIHQFTASGLVKEVASLGGNVEEFVSENIMHRLQEQFAAQNHARNPVQPSRKEDEGD